MARKKKKQESKIKFKDVVIVVGFFIAALVIGIFAFNFFNDSEYFSVKTIKIDSSLQFIDKSDLSVFKDKNIFEVDLVAAQRRLQKKYPQVSELKVVKRFPNEVVVVAKKRRPFAQAIQDQVILTFDEQGVILSKSSQLNKRLPQILGLARQKNAQLGRPFNSIRLSGALKVLRVFDENKNAFTSIGVVSVDVTKLSKIKVLLTNKLEVILDQDKLESRIKKLALIIAQKTLDLSEVKYVDLRFKEAIVGKK